MSGYLYNAVTLVCALTTDMKIKMSAAEHFTETFFKQEKSIKHDCPVITRTKK